MECKKAQALLSAFLDRQLPGADHRAVDDHLASCQACRAVLADYQEMDRLLARMRNRGPSASIVTDVGEILRGGKPVAKAKAGSSRHKLAALLILVVFVASAGALAAFAANGRRAAVAGNGFLYIALGGAEDRVAVVDVESARLAGTVYIGARPLQLALSPRGERLYVLTETSISVVDTTQSVVVDRYLLPARAAGLAVSPDGKTLYTTLYERRSVIILEADSGRPVGDVRVGRMPREVVVSPDSQWVLVYNSGDNTLSKIKTSTMQESKVLRLLRRNDTVAEFSLHPMAVGPDGRKLYVSELNRERIWVIDLLSDSSEAFDVPLRDFGRDLALSPVGDRLYATHGDPRGQRANLAGLASLALPGVERQAEIRGFYHGVAVSPDGALIFATNPDENVVIIADAKSLQTQATVPVGQRPTAIVYGEKK